MTSRQFGNFAVIDWSGEAVERPKGLAVALARAGVGPPALLKPERRWSRQAILDWLFRLADSGEDILIGLDLSPALPFADRDSYFPGWPDGPRDAKELWALVDRASADDMHLSASNFLCHAHAGEHFLHQNRRGSAYEGTSGRLRRCEVSQAAAGLSPYSCFRLIGAAQVGKSSLTGMRVLHQLGGRIPLWPFDPVPPSGPVLVEIYTTVAAVAARRSKGRSKMRCVAELNEALVAIGSAPIAGDGPMDDHSTDALLTAAWLRRVAHAPGLWRPSALTPDIARTEGWTFGVA